MKVKGLMIKTNLYLINTVTREKYRLYEGVRNNDLYIRQGKKVFTNIYYIISTNENFKIIR